MDTTITVQPDTILAVVRLAEASSPFWPTLIPVVVGGLLATAGGLTGAYLQARRTRQVRTDEVFAERQIDATQEALERLVSLNTYLATQGLAAADNLVTQYDEWFQARRLYTPAKVATIWVALRQQLAHGQVLESNTSRNVEDLQRLRIRVAASIEAGIKAAYAAMKVAPPETYTFVNPPADDGQRS